VDVGIVGLPRSGRTTVFRALLAHRAPKETGGRGPSATVGTIHVQDPRLDRLGEQFRPEKVVPIEIRVHDLCTSLEGGFPSAEIEGMRRMDVLLLVVPTFLSPGPEEAGRELDRLVSDLLLADLTVAEGRLDRAKKEKIADSVRRALELARDALEAERPLLRTDLSAPDREALSAYGFLSDRPWVAIDNVGEAEVGRPPPAPLVERGEELGLPVLALCAALESEMAELPPEERSELLAEYGVQEPAGAAVTRTVLAKADRIPFFTVGEDECRAWAIPRGTTARKAAGKVHSHIERGFIRAEVIDAEELLRLPGALAEAKKLGKLRVEGKDYVVQDGEVVHFRFNV
jgi:ribosome-binding ATPase YchF (GTP1/OBG family)